MSQQEGTIPCPDCGTDAALMSDKRLKLFITCPDCGRFPYNTIKGQQRLVDRVNTMLFQDSPETPARAAPETQERNTGMVYDDPETGSVTSSEKTRGKAGKSGGFWVMLAGTAAIVGGLAWRAKNSQV